MEKSGANFEQIELEKTANKLKNKYFKKRKVNSLFFVPKSTGHKVLSIVFDIACAVVVLLSSFVCFSAINSKIQHTCPTIAGYTNMVVQTGSMTNSGLNVGDTVIVKSVNARTINEDDIIAFYVYSKDYN